MLTYAIMMRIVDTFFVIEIRNNQTNKQKNRRKQAKKIECRH